MGKGTYRVTNWKSYNEGLKHRGSLTLWISAEVLDGWREPVPLHPRRGARKQYSDLAILTCLTVRSVYHLTLRGCEGFVESLFSLLHLTLAVPDYTVLCRRARTLEVGLPRLPSGGALDVLVDSTGLKVYGEGEWKVRKLGWGRRRRWMKLHLMEDAGSGMIAGVVLTTNAVGDSQGAEQLLRALPSGAGLRSFTGDVAYDKVRVRRWLGEGVEQIIPPQSDAVRGGSGKPWFSQRDQALRQIEQVGRKWWKQFVGYPRRSRIEATMYRYKTMIGERLRARTLPSQTTEVRIACRLLNDMLQAAKPLSQKVA